MHVVSPEKSVGAQPLHVATSYAHRVLVAHRRVEFVWDFVGCNVPFDNPHAILDASEIPLLKLPRGGARKFRRTYGLSMLLAFTESAARKPSEMDWFTGVY